jgi:myosin VI
MDHGKKVWAPDLKDGFILGEISDFGTDEITVQPLNGSKVVQAPYDAVYPAVEEGAKDVDDNCACSVGGCAIPLFLAIRRAG